MPLCTTPAHERLLELCTFDEILQEHVAADDYNPLTDQPFFQRLRPLFINARHRGKIQNQLLGLPSKTWAYFVPFLHAERRNIELYHYQLFTIKQNLKTPKKDQF
jgi:hypothetical protein